MTKKRWTVEFSDEDWLSVELDIEQGKVKRLVLNYLAHIQDAIREVARYDTDHGYLHLHQFWLDEERQVTEFEDPQNPSGDYGAAFSAAASDLRANWSNYRLRMEQRMRRKGEKHGTKEKPKGSSGKPRTGAGLRSKGNPRA